MAQPGLHPNQASIAPLANLLAAMTGAPAQGQQLPAVNTFSAPALPQAPPPHATQVDAAGGFAAALSQFMTSMAASNAAQAAVQQPPPPAPAQPAQNLTLALSHLFQGGMVQPPNEQQPQQLTYQNQQQQPNTEGSTDGDGDRPPPDKRPRTS